MNHPSLRSWSVRTHDIDEANECLSAQLRRTSLRPGSEGGLDIQCTGHALDGLLLCDFHTPSGFEARALEPTREFSLCFSWDAHLKVMDSDGRHVLASEPDGGIILPPGEYCRFAHAPGCSVESIMLSPASVLDALASTLDAPVLPDLVFHPQMQMNSAGVRAVRLVAQAIRMGSSGDGALLKAPLAVLSLRQAMIWLFVEGLPHNHSERLNRTPPATAPRNVRRAIEFMRAHVSRPITLADIARASATSARSLQAAFQRSHATTPMGYLRKLRLAGAHGELLVGLPGSTVREIALRWGFVNPGAFSQRYHQAYGVAPSITLGKSANR